ncbi:hypothetical protein [Kineothrix alysoides]
MPQEEGGTDTHEHAAPLCSRCHDLFGDNASKGKNLIPVVKKFKEE